MQKLIVGALAAASLVGAVAVTAAPTEASAQPYYGRHYGYRHHYRPYYGYRRHYWRRHGYRPYYRHHYRY